MEALALWGSIKLKVSAANLCCSIVCDKISDGSRPMELSCFEIETLDEMNM